jgi:hypothetical protein
MSKGKKVKWKPITWQEVKWCFSNNRARKYDYLGYTFNLFEEQAGEPYQVIEDVVALVDRKAKPWWCPRFILNLLNLYGNDNSLIRVRNRTLHNLLNKITKGYRIYDIKEKFGLLRIYGDFDDEIDTAVYHAEEVVDQYFADHYLSR